MTRRADLGKPSGHPSEVYLDRLCGDWRVRAKGTEAGYIANVAEVNPGKWSGSASPWMATKADRGAVQRVLMALDTWENHGGPWPGGGG